MQDVSEILENLNAGLTFFRQERVDGGVRTGIMLGMTSVFERFEIGGEEHDPRLAWSIDLRCNGPSLPTAADEAKQWLSEREKTIRDGFHRYSAELAAGSDPTDIYLLEWQDFGDLPPGVSMKIVCGAMRRIDALYLARRLDFIGEHWVELVRDLEPAFDNSY